MIIILRSTDKFIKSRHLSSNLKNINFCYYALFNVNNEISYYVFNKLFCFICHFKNRDSFLL